MSKEKYKFEILKKDNYHIYYEDRDDNAGGAIVYKNLKNNEFFEQSAKIENLIDFYNTCEMCIINFWHLLPFGKNKNDKNKLILLTDIKSSHADLNNTTSLDTFKLEAEHQAATAIVEANMAEFHAERQEIKEKEREEREALIAEASRLTGRVEAFNFISKVADTSTFITLKNIKENGIYKELPNIKTWEDYCLSIGYTRRYVDKQIDNISTLGDNFLAVSRQFGVSYKDLRELRKQVKSGNLEVKDAEVIIDGEVIPLDDKDELRDALDTLLKSKYKKIEELKDEIKNKESIIEDKEHDIKRLQASNNTFFKEKEQAEKELKDILAVGFIKNIPIEENKDFTMIADVEREIEIVLNHLYVITHREYKEKQEDDTYKIINLEELSSFNKLKLGAVVIKAMNLFHNLHQELCSLGISDYFGDAFVDDDVIDAEDAVTTPNMFLKQQGNEDE